MRRVPAFTALRNGSRALLWGLLAIVIGGCSSSMTRLQTWEGKTGVEPADLAVLEAPGAIQVTQVNGRPMGNYLMDDLDLSYELLPGTNRVVFRYKTIWAKAEVVENGESKVHVVETPPQSVSFEASPGEVYRFEFERPASRSEAEAGADSFSAAIVNARGEQVAVSGPWKGEAESAVAAAPAAAATGGQATLEELKALWQQASKEERQEFLRWAL